MVAGLNMSMAHSITAPKLGDRCKNIFGSALTRRTRHAQRGRAPKTEPPPMVSGYRLVVEVDRLANPEEDNGWTVLATTVSAAACIDAEVLQAYQEQHTTVEP